MAYIPWWQRMSPPTFTERFDLGGLAGRVGFKDNPLKINTLSNKEIAREHGITERTVKEYVGTLLHKFEAKDRISLLLRLGEFSHLKDAL